MLVTTEVGAPALLVGGEPGSAALGALRDQGDALGVHAATLRDPIEKVLGVRLAARSL
jgi:hypothetical protein